MCGLGNQRLRKGEVVNKAMRRRQIKRSHLVMAALVFAVGVALYLASSGPRKGTALSLADFDGAAEGSALEDGTPYFSYSIRPFVEPGIEIISVEPVEIEGSVHVDGIFVLKPDHPQPSDIFAPEPEIQAFLDGHRAEQVSQVDDCGSELCEIVFAIVARRVSSETDGVVRGIKVHYLHNGKEYVEQTKFAVGLCLPDNFEDCTYLGKGE